MRGALPLQPKLKPAGSAAVHRRRLYGLVIADVKSLSIQSAVALPGPSSPTETQLNVYGATGVATASSGPQTPLVAARVRVTKLELVPLYSEYPAMTSPALSIARAPRLLVLGDTSAVIGVAVVWNEPLRGRNDTSTFELSRVRCCHETAASPFGPIAAAM